MASTRLLARLVALSAFLVIALPLAVGLAGSASAGPATAPPPAAPAFHDAAGIHVVAVTQIDPRQYDVKVLSAALGRPVDVRILVPAAYEQNPQARYPVLYLFHGTSGRASDWVNFGNAEQTTAVLPLITVMPDAGFGGDGGGWFTNWVDTGTVLGPSMWETFHIGQLLPWVDANLRTIATRDGRAVAGLSQGGFGSMSYAARHPDLFVSAASFSGAPDIASNPVILAGAAGVVEATASFLDGVQPEAMFGNPLTNNINWRGHNPTDLAVNLRGMDLWEFTASGVNGPLDPPAPNPAGTAIELITHVSTQSFVARLAQLGITNHYDDYVWGTHSFPYWARDLTQYIGPLMQVFAAPPQPLAKVTYTSVDASYSQWGWSVAMQRAAPQAFTTLSDADASGFTFQGNGTATITTPAVYRRGERFAITVSGIAGGGTQQVTAGDDGRLRITVALGAGLVPIDVLPGEAITPATAHVAIAPTPNARSRPTLTLVSCSDMPGRAPCRSATNPRWRPCPIHAMTSSSSGTRPCTTASSRGSCLIVPTPGTRRTGECSSSSTRPSCRRRRTTP